MPEDFLSKRDNFDQWFAAFQKSISLATKTAIYKTKTKTTPRHAEMPSTDYAQYFGLSPAMIVACCTLTDTIRSGNSTLCPGCSFYLPQCSYAVKTSCPCSGPLTNRQLSAPVFNSTRGSAYGMSSFEG